MGKWRHRLSNKDLVEKIADCSFCGRVPIVLCDRTWKCKPGRGMNRSTKNSRWLYRKNFIGNTKDEIKNCSKCDIQNIDLRFFDVNHKDGDHENNSLDNLELLCPNCHRIESLKQWKENSMKRWNRNYLMKN